MKHSHHIIRNDFSDWLAGGGWLKVTITCILATSFLQMLENGFAIQFWVTPLFPIRAVSLASSQRWHWRSVYAAKIIKTRMHSSRMRTARSLTVSCHILCMPPPPHNHTPPPAIHAPCNHTCPPNHTSPPTTMHPPATMHAPSNYAPPATMHTPRNHACPPTTMHAPPQPHMPPSNHACPPATTHPPPWTEWQTGVKILPCPKLRLRAVNIFFTFA